MLLPRQCLGRVGSQVSGHPAHIAPALRLSSVSCSDHGALLEQGCAPWKRGACLLKVGVNNWEQVTFKL